MDKIVTLQDKEHNYKKLVEIFDNLSKEDLKKISESLSINNNTSFYTVDISSNKNTYINNDYNRVLTAKLFNYFIDKSDIVSEWNWSRDSGNTVEDNLWKIGKNTQQISLTKDDFTDRIFLQDITFKVEIVVNGDTYSDTISFSKISNYSKVKITTDNYIFIDDNPSNINFNIETDITDIKNIKWYLDGIFKSNQHYFTVNNADIGLGSASTIKVEVTDLNDNIYTDILVIPKISSANNSNNVANEGVFIAPMGEWKQDHLYKGNQRRIEAVKFNNKWYITKKDLPNGIVPLGVPPTNTDYWNESDVEYDFIATGIFLAESASIDNLLIKRLRTSDIELCDNPNIYGNILTNTQRLEIDDKENSLKFFTGNEPFTPCQINPRPTIEISASPGLMDLNSIGDDNASVTIISRNSASNNTTYISTSGIFSNSGNTSFLPLSSGVSSSASVVGLQRGSYVNKGGYFDIIGFHAAVVGINQDRYTSSDANEKLRASTGSHFGGYFNSILIGGKYSYGKVVSDTGDVQINPNTSKIFCYGSGTVNLILPDFKKSLQGWNENIIWEVQIAKVSDAKTVNIQTSDNANILSLEGSSPSVNTITLTGSSTSKSVITCYWDGNRWSYKKS